MDNVPKLQYSLRSFLHNRESRVLEHPTYFCSTMIFRNTHLCSTKYSLLTPKIGLQSNCTLQTDKAKQIQLRKPAYSKQFYDSCMPVVVFFGEREYSKHEAATNLKIFIRGIVII